MIGGGFAGLCLARHLSRVRPDTAITVVDRRALPGSPERRVIGESTSEIAAWYLARRLGLRDSLAREQVVKFGLRFWLPSTVAGATVDQRVEFGPMVHPPDGVPFEPHAYQLHRGRLEATLARELVAAGVELIAGFEVEAVDGGPGAWTLRASGDRAPIRSRWIVDASADGAPSRRQFGPDLGERTLAHPLVAAWWWVDGHLDPGAWSPGVAARGPTLRWRSTQHFLGSGYWAWLIPLADGSTSVGVVASPSRRPRLVESSGLVDACEGLLAAEEPQLWAAVSARARVAGPVARRLSPRVFEAPLQPGWLVTGAALGFVDPLYSSGHDLVAICHELGVPVVASALDGADPRPLRAGVNRAFGHIVDHYATMHEGSWPVLADPQLAGIKLAWDQLAYFSWLCPLAFSGRLGTLDGQAPRVRQLAQRAHGLGACVQAMLRAWAPRRRPLDDRGRAVSLSSLPTVFAAFRGLASQASSVGVASSAQLLATLERGVDGLERTAMAVFALAGRDLDLNLPEEPIDPLGLSLDPERWAVDGLFHPRRARRRIDPSAGELAALWPTEAGR